MLLLLLMPILLLFSNCVWFLTVLLGLIAILLGSISSFSCQTITFSQAGGGSLDSGPFYYRSSNLVFLQIGNSTQYAFDSCRPYSVLDDIGFIYDVDSTTVAVRVFASIAIATGFISVFGVLSVPFIGASLCAWNMYGFLLILTCVVQAFTMLIMSSSLCLNNPILQIMEDISLTSALRDSFEDECRPYRGYNMNIVSIIFYGIAGILVLIMPAPEKWQDDWCSSPPLDDDDEKEEEATKKPVEEEEEEGAVER